MAACTISKEFHQFNHLDLKQGATLTMDTLCNFVMEMLGVGLREKWRLICFKGKTHGEEDDNGEEHKCKHQKRKEEMEGASPQRTHLCASCLQQLQTSQSS